MLDTVNSILPLVITVANLVLIVLASLIYRAQFHLDRRFTITALPLEVLAFHILKYFRARKDEEGVMLVETVITRLREPKPKRKHNG